MNTCQSYGDFFFIEALLKAPHFTVVNHMTYHKFCYIQVSKHQEVCFTPVTKVPKLIVVFLDLVGAIKKVDKYHTNHIKIGEQYSSSNKPKIMF